MRRLLLDIYPDYQRNKLGYLMRHCSLHQRLNMMFCQFHCMVYTHVKESKSFSLQF